MTDITVDSSDKLALLSAQRTLASVVDFVMRAQPDWVVLVRSESWNDRPLMYAFRPGELLLAEQSKRDLPVAEALDLLEEDESRQILPGEKLTLPPPKGTQPSASRAIILDADGEPTAVGETARAADGKGSVNGGERETHSKVWRSPKVWRSAEPDFGDDLGLGTVRGVQREVREVPRMGGGSGGPASADGSTSESHGGGSGSAGGIGSGGGGTGTGSGGDVDESVEAMLTAEAPAEVLVGDEVPVTVLVGLASETLPFAGGSITTAVSAREQITALITVSGGALQAMNPRIIKLNPPRANEPSQSAFTVRGVSPGRARVGIIFRQGGTELGTLTMAVNVAASRPSAVESGTVRAEAVAAPRDRGEDGGLLLLIDEDAENGLVRYRYRVVSAPLGLDYAEFSSEPLKVLGGGNASTARAYVESIYTQITERVLRNSDDLSAFARELRAIGSELCRELIPGDLARQLWANRANIGGVLVRSWEPYVPWELLRLRNPDSHDNEADEHFLAEYNLVRSLNGTTRPRLLALRDWRYVAAKYESGYAQPVGAELDSLRAVLPQKYGIQPIAVAPTVNTVLDALKSPDFDVLHIACHGEASHNDIARSTLIIADRPGGAGKPPLPVAIDSRTVSAEANLRQRHPLVFLNACESGRLGASLTEWGGWPKTFWERGAGAFVGTSWPVREKPARIFAETFYDSLLAGKTLAEAAGAARAAAKALGDASWLAYKVYGHPNAQKG